MFANGNSISYLYDAAGTKLRTHVLLEGDSVTTDYCGNVVYENGVPQILLTEVGYASLPDGKYHYYPFGGVFSSTGDAQLYKYNGKELDRKGGLDWYDYGARYYDAALGRWHVVDPMAEEYYDLNPYNYCGNNNVNNIDINGDSITILNYGYGDKQHMALLIQNTNDKWQYFSINGNNVYISGKFSGGRKFDDIAIGEFDTPEEFLKSKYNSSGDADDMNVNSYGFSEGYMIPTNKDQDNAIRDAFLKISNNEEYSLMSNNCATAVQRAIEVAGIRTHLQKHATFRMPQTNYSMKKLSLVLHAPVSRSIVPSVAFKLIIQLNPNGRIIKK